MVTFSGWNWTFRKSSRPKKHQSISKEVRCSMSMCRQALKQCRRHARAQSQGMYLAVLFAMPWWDAGSSRTQGMLALHAICQFMETDLDCLFFWCCLHIVTASSSCTQVDFFEACSLSSLSRSLWMMRCAAPAGEMSRRMFSITLCG